MAGKQQLENGIAVANAVTAALSGIGAAGRRAARSLQAHVQSHPFAGPPEHANSGRGRDTSAPFRTTVQCNLSASGRIRVGSDQVNWKDARHSERARLARARKASALAEPI